MINMLTQVIDETFRTSCDKFQNNKPESERRAFRVKLRTAIDHSKEEGYRRLEVVIYGPNNYVQVWVRSCWNVIPLEDLEYDESSDESTPKPGKDYIKGSSNWQLISNHDSGYHDGITRILRENEKIIQGFSGSSWYDLIPIHKFLLC